MAHREIRPSVINSSSSNNNSNNNYNNNNNNNVNSNNKINKRLSEEVHMNQSPHAQPERVTPFMGSPVPNTVLIGDSLLKGIKKRGLTDDVMVATLPGKLTTDVCIRLRNWDMSCCRNVVVYVGGNDVAAGNSMTSIEHELRRMLECLNDGRRRVFLCTVCPRRDVNVTILNAMIRNVCSTTYAEPIGIHSVFRVRGRKFGPQLISRGRHTPQLERKQHDCENLE